jgi:hypothetical protein
MCTVTFIPAKDKIFITSNRDEKTVRKQAIPPQPYLINKATILFPKDADAGGTWIAMKNNRHAAVLLNGGFVKHTANPPYARSRGLVFLEIAAAEDAVKHYHQISLENIEPFTTILYRENELFECRWDGSQKHIKQLSSTEPHIWSSVTLYDNDVIRRRERWFSKWLERNSNPTQEDIFFFHQFGGDGDEENALVMKRQDIYHTVSVTGIELRPDNGKMKYLDMKDGRIYEQDIRLTPHLIN